MSMNQIIGEFQEEIMSHHALFLMDFFMHSVPRGIRSKTRYLSIAFVVDYLAAFFPANEDDINSYERLLQIKSAASYITNELLENSIKFNDEKNKVPIKFGVCILDKNIVFVNSNSVAQSTLGKLTDFVVELSNSDIDELYFRQLEKGAEENSNESRLGFLSMMNDYSAKLGWKIETINENSGITTVTTMVQLAI